MKKLIYLFLALLIVACSDDEGNPCVYNPTLTTSAVTNVTETSATLNGVISIVSENCEDPTNTEQGFVYATTIQPTTNNTQVNVNGTNITATLENLESNTTYYVRTFLTNALGEFYGNEVSFMTSEEPLDCEVVYLAKNGITIKACEDANVGETGVINGVEYTVLDRAMLLQIAGYNGGGIVEDLTKICTTRVTDMSDLFYGCNEPFNQPIGNWDVSNVTNMSYMFIYECGLMQFNRNISQWDVSNVTNMSFMFGDATSFNQPIENWNTSNVTDMSYMFKNATSFNQDISSWSVDGVTNCADFSNNSPLTEANTPNFTNCTP